MPECPGVCAPKSVSEIEDSEKMASSRLFGRLVSDPTLLSGRRLEVGVDGFALRAETELMFLLFPGHRQLAGNPADAQIGWRATLSDGIDNTGR